MKLQKRSILLGLTVTTLISGCEFIDKSEKIIMPILSNLEKTVTETQIVRIKCKKNNIEEYKKAGWEIIETKEKEVVCSWKTKQSRRGCDLNEDKGCKITVPDKRGKEIEYKLEKKIRLKIWEKNKNQSD